MVVDVPSPEPCGGLWTGSSQEAIAPAQGAVVAEHTRDGRRRTADNPTRAAGRHSEQADHTAQSTPLHPLRTGSAQAGGARTAQPARVGLLATGESGRGSASR
jgi:hypothetical protein